MAQKSYKPTRQYGGIDADQRRKERREKLVAAGLEAFGTMGFGQATITQICRLAKLNERYYYESFKKKDDLLCAVFRRLISELEIETQKIVETPGITPEDAVYLSIKHFYLRFLKDPRRARVQLFEVLGVSPKVDKEYQGSMQTLAHWVELSCWVFFPAIDRQWLAKSILPTTTAGGIVWVAHKWVLEGYKTPVDTIVAQAMDMFIVLGNHYQYEKNRLRI